MGGVPATLSAVPGPGPVIGKWARVARRSRAELKTVPQRANEFSLVS